VNAAAAGLAAGLALEELRAVFGEAVPIDTIDVRISEDDESHYVEVGKYVARDVFVRYGHTFGPEPEEEVGVSLRLGDHWILESTTNSDATAGGDVYWVLEY
jgi:autotransporter translocation and assembly factor TamB